MTRRALFLLPSDRMGGSERVVRTIAREAAQSGLFDSIDIYILCWHRSGTLDDLEVNERINLYYGCARSTYRGMISMVRFMIGREYKMILSSATHINALISLLRRLWLVETKYLVARESANILDRDFGRRGIFVRSLYWLYGAQDLIICQTERMRDSLDRHTGGRLRRLLITSPNPLDLSRIEAGRLLPIPCVIKSIPPSRTKIVWCGRLSTVKAPIRAVEVLKALHEGGCIHMHLVMIGDGPMHQEVKEAVAQLGLVEYVTLLGQLDNPTGVMALCDLGLLTSSNEGFPNVILEFIASGVRRVVTTNCAGDLDDLPGVLLSKNGSVDELASLLCCSMEERFKSNLEVFLNLRRSDKYFQNLIRCGEKKLLLQNA